MEKLLLLYAAGHLFVAFAVLVILSFARRHPNLGRRRQCVFELVSKPKRREEANAEIAASRAELAAIIRRLEQLGQLIRDLVPLNEPPSVKFTFGVLALVLTEIEAALFFVLGAFTGALGLSPEVWAFAAPPVAATWVLILHGVLVSVVADSHRPQQTVRRGKLGAAVSGVAFVIGVWLLLSGRTLTDIGVIEQVVGLGLTITTAILSIAAAFCSLVTVTLFEEERYEREIVRLEKRRFLYDQHIEYIERDLERNEPEDDAGPGAAVAAAVLLLMLLTSAGSAAGQTTAHAHVGFARTGACEFLVDITKSVDHEALKEAIVQTSENLPGIVNALNCSIIRVTPFAGSLFQAIDEIPIPMVAENSVDCEGATSAAGGTHKQLIEKWYPAVEAAHKRDALAGCKAQQQKAREESLAQQRAAIEDGADRLRMVSNLKPAGPCTALPHAVSRALARSQHVVVIADGVATCTPPSTLATVQNDATLLFLLVPPKSPGAIDGANQLLKHAAAIEKTFRGGTALFAPEATRSFWKREGTR